MIKRTILVCLTLAISSAHAEGFTQPKDCNWCDNLLDYGMMREEHDRSTFPRNMPKVGERYDPVTGNAIGREIVDEINSEQQRRECEREQESQLATGALGRGAFKVTGCARSSK